MPVRHCFAGEDDDGPEPPGMEFFVCGGVHFLGCSDESSILLCTDEQDHGRQEGHGAFGRREPPPGAREPHSPTGVEISGDAAELRVHAHAVPVSSFTGEPVDLTGAPDPVIDAMRPSDATAQLIREFELGSARASAQWGPDPESDADRRERYDSMLQRTFVTNAPWQALYDLMPLRPDERDLFEKHLDREIIWARMKDTERNATLLWRAAQLGDAVAVSIMIRKRLGDLAGERDSGGLNAMEVAKLEGHHECARLLEPFVRDECVTPNTPAARKFQRGSSKSRLFNGFRMPRLLSFRGKPKPSPKPSPPQRSRSSTQ